MKKKNDAKLYLYLARRDRQGIILLATFHGVATTTRIQDVHQLGMSTANTEKLRAVVHENRIHHELWVEPAESFAALSRQLLKRGYTRMPLAATPLLDFAAGFTVTTGSLQARKTMTRKQK